MNRAPLGAALLAIASLPVGAAQNDLMLPTDYVSLPNGAMNVAAYAAQQTLSGPWKEGSLQRPGEISTNLVAFRASRHFSVGDQGKYTIAPVAIITASESDANASLATVTGRHASGIGDLRLGTAFWFHSDHANREYVMAALLVSLPTGQYNPTQLLNIGENRRKTTLSFGLMQALGQRWVMDLAPEVAFYGDNTQYRSTRRLSQDTSYAVTGTLRYRATPDWHVYSSAQINRGGATEVNARASTGAPDNTRLAIGTLLFTGTGSQVQLRYARDVQTQNGFRNDGELVLRWSRVFQ